MESPRYAHECANSANSTACLVSEVDAYIRLNKLSTLIVDGEFSELDDT